MTAEEPAGVRYVEGRTGLRGFAALCADSFRLIRDTRHLRLSYLWWAFVGLVYTEAFGVGVAQMVGRHEAVVAGVLAAAWWLFIALVLGAGASLLHELPSMRRVPYYGIPNGLTALRAWSCVPLLSCALLDLPGRRGLVLWCAIGAPAGLLDLVDGYIARHVGPVTELGRALDPAGDALFFAVAAIGSERLGIVPVWLMALMLFRYLGPLLGTPVVFLARRKPDLVFTRWGRMNTGLTGVVLFVLMWVRIAGGPVNAVALALAAPLLGTTMLLHFVTLARRAHDAPVVRERLRDRYAALRDARGRRG